MMRAITVLSAAVLALAGCGGADAAAPVAAPSAKASPTAMPAAAPDIARCDAQHVQHPNDPIPVDPVAIPKAFQGIAKASARELALLSQSGATVCDRAVGIDAVANMAWLRKDRLLGWEWQAYEAFGYVVFDRAGKGAVIETGVKPTFSPGGGRFASVEFSDFGALSGFAVWEVNADGLTRIGGETSRSEGEGADFVIIEPEVFTDRFGDWSISGWKGETCVSIAFDGEQLSPDAAFPGQSAFHAAEGARWQIAPGPCP
ncbi:MAG: hypothetical protein C0472_04775 [Erythrobacter sp.]|nr:hypothetical protein [Erythrobacter sp.]